MGRPVKFDPTVKPAEYHYNTKWSPKERKQNYQRVKVAQKRYNILCSDEAEE